MLHDISPPIHPELRVWPGDVAFSRAVRSDIQAGASTTTSAMQTTLHIGAHADAPSHYGSNAPTIDQCDLETFLGPCQVVRVAVGRGAAVTPALIPASIRAPRVLIATGTCPDPMVFNEDFAGLTVELIDHLHEHGARLVGVDTPSVDRFADDELPVHRRALEHQMAILEGLALADVPAGLYELIALPLRLVGCDASPVRAVLRTKAGGG